MSRESKCNSCNNKNIKCDVCSATSDIYNHHPCYQPKPQTNFDKITSSAEILADYIIQTAHLDFGGIIYKSADGKFCETYEEARLRTIEWLQQECENQ